MWCLRYYKETQQPGMHKQSEPRARNHQRHTRTRNASLVTKRRNSWACRGNPNPEQETIKGTHTQETPALLQRDAIVGHAEAIRTQSRKPSTSLPTQANHTVRGARKQPPNWALHMQLAKIPHTHQTTPPATRAASADQHGTHRGRNRYHPSTSHCSVEA